MENCFDSYMIFNLVTIKDTGLSPVMEQYAKLFRECECYGVFDLIVEFD